MKGSHRTVLEIACRPAVVRRAGIMSAIVGTILGLINHGDAIVLGTIGPADIIRVAVTYLVPYTVSTVSSVLAIREGALQSFTPKGYDNDQMVKVTE